MLFRNISFGLGQSHGGVFTNITRNLSQTQLLVTELMDVAVAFSSK